MPAWTASGSGERLGDQRGGELGVLGLDHRGGGDHPARGGAPAVEVAALARGHLSCPRAEYLFKTASADVVDALRLSVIVNRPPQLTLVV
ncbi:hypothetical protein AB0B45_50135 [Nonomuraea sp. NPDC049152]|uniref:hypothetical protein n=1 Tax=Nonomuraea sp. NPDC049152 TaxID=3154350 RepID=UPI0033E82B35